MLFIWRKTDNLLKKYAKESTHAGDFGPDPDECHEDWYWASEMVKRDFFKLKDNVLSDLYHSGVWVGHYWEIVTIDERGWFRLWRNMEELLEKVGHEALIFLDDDGMFRVEMKGRTPSSLVAYKFDENIWKELSEKYREQCFDNGLGHKWESYNGALSAVRNFWNKLVPKSVILKSLKSIGSDVEKRLKKHGWDFNS